MMIKNRISIFLVTFLIIGFFFIALPEKGNAGLSLGCCLSPPNGTSSCIGCGGLDCAIRFDLCEVPPNNFQPGDTCINTNNGAECGGVFGATGCCINLGGNCLEERLEIGECASGDEALAWFLGTDCSEVPGVHHHLSQPYPNGV